MRAILREPLFNKEQIENLKNLDKQQTLLLLKSIWPHHDYIAEDGIEETHSAFFDYIYRELSSLHSHSGAFAVQSFESMGKVIKDICADTSKSRADIVKELKHKFHNYGDDAIARSVELALRLCLTINIRSPISLEVGLLQGHANTCAWDETESLANLLTNVFAASICEVSQSEFSIDRRFKAPFLTYVCGIKIDWTDNLVDHLEYNRSLRSVKIYQHKIWLANHLQSSPKSLIPANILEEAMDTLNLLFPWGDEDTTTLLQQARKPFWNLGNQGREPVYDLRQYTYWRNRLIHLIREFEEPPYGVAQLWRDRRNILQWLTFWIAVFIFVLTIVSIICGIMATYFTYKQYEVAWYQACSGEERSAALHAYCSRK